MIGSTSGRGKAEAIRWALLGAVCALVIGIYAWCANSGELELLGSGSQDSYYNLLVRGFQACQLSVKKDAPTGLTKLSDPYDPNASYPYRFVSGATLHDMSYYRGKLYLYFGVTPALVLFWPYAALTGHYLLHKEAVLVFCAMGFLAGVGLLIALWRRYFAGVSFGVLVAGALALGLTTGTPVMLQRCDVYEVAISCGHALTMLTLTAIWASLQESRRRGLWLATASLAYGLAVGARPSLLFGAVILLVPVIQAWRVRRQFWVQLFAASGPIVFIGLGLMLYNFLRFGNPLEFGVRYQLSGFREGTVHHFSLSYLWFNFRVSFLAPLRWGGRFPFVHDIVVPPLPVDYGLVEHPLGVLSNIPLVWLALAAPLAWCGPSMAARNALRWFLAAVALLCAACALTLGLFFAACFRYEMEFVPALVLLAVVGIFGLERALAGRPFWLRVVRWGWGLLLAVSVTLNLLSSVEWHADAHTSIGGALVRKGKLQEAIVHYQKALEIQPDSAEIHTQLGSALLLQGHVDEAIVHCRKALEVEPGSAKAHYGLAKGLIQKGQMEEALAHFQIAENFQPVSAEINFNLGWILFNKGRLDEAIAHYQKALEIQPDYAKAHSNLGLVLLQKGRVDEAFAHYQKALELEPNSAEIQYNLGNVLLQKGQVDEAIARYQKATELQPDFAQAHNNLGWVLLRTGRLEEAVAQFQKAVESQPGSAEAHSNLGSALSAQRRLDAAVREFEEALRLKPDDAAASNQLAAALGMKEKLATPPANSTKP